MVGYSYHLTPTAFSAGAEQRTFGDRATDQVQRSAAASGAHARGPARARAGPTACRGGGNHEGWRWRGRSTGRPASAPRRSPEARAPGNRAGRAHLESEIQSQKRYPICEATSRRCDAHIDADVTPSTYHYRLSARSYGWVQDGATVGKTESYCRGFCGFVRMSAEKSVRLQPYRLRP